MKKITLSLLFAPLILGACQDYALNRQQMDQELGYICSTAINARIGSVEYGNCRQYYDRVLLQYDINVSRPWSFDVSTVANRSRPLADRCRSYSSNPKTVWNCLQEQENMMLAEYIRKKLLKEEQDAKKELIRTQEYERAQREKAVVKEREKQKARYNPKPQPVPHSADSGRGDNGGNTNANSGKNANTNENSNSNSNTNTIIINVPQNTQPKQEG